MEAKESKAEMGAPQPVVRYPYFPKVFSKLKTLLRGLAPRAKDSLWTNIGSRLDSFFSRECKNDFTFCGYVIKQIKNALAARLAMRRQSG
jgi:hypothetical protein